MKTIKYNILHTAKRCIYGGIILLLSLTATIISAHAQEAPPQVPPKKNMMVTKLPTLPQQPVKLPFGTPTELPGRPNPVLASLTIHNWQLIRWWTTGNIGHSVTDVAFKFNAGGTVSCNLNTPEAKTSLQSGTYTINGNNVSISLKKDANVLMNCSLVYNSNAKTLTGTYSLQVLPIVNPPVGYIVGTVTGDMILEIK